MASSHAYVDAVTSTKVVLIRHCESQVDPALPPTTWGLTKAGHAQAGGLAGASFCADLIAVACGDEPKMVQTVEPLTRAVGLSVEQNVAYRESHSEGWFDGAGFEDIVGAFFRERAVAPAPGWEPAGEAAERFGSALEQQVARVGVGGTVVVCSGGRVLTAVLARLDLIAPSQLLETWRRLRAPDVAVIEFVNDDEPILVRTFGGPRAL